MAGSLQHGVIISLVWRGGNMLGGGTFSPLPAWHHLVWRLAASAAT